MIICSQPGRRGGRSISKVVAKQEFERKRPEEQWMFVSLRLGVHLVLALELNETAGGRAGGRGEGARGLEMAIDWPFPPSV